MYVVDLKDVRKESILTVGGKGANLGEMVAQGFPVPPGFCVTSYGYDAYIQENEFLGLIDRTLDSIYSNPSQGAKLAISLMQNIKNGKISNEMYLEIEEAYKKMGKKVRTAVRSSATAEDLPEASFAGQQETYLNVQGIDDVVYSIKSCFASLWTERAISYRKKKGFDKQKISLAVVVQEMVEGDVSGVLFTVNPMNGDKNEMMINSSYGLGESIVSGLVTPDTFIWDKKQNIVKQKVLGNKEIAIVYKEDGGTKQKSNNFTLKNKYSISDEQLQELASLSGKIENHYNVPQDIEWAIKNNNIYVLQSRGITTLESTKKVSEVSGTKKQNKRERMMMNNLLEHCPTPLYPLDFAPICRVLRGKTETMKEIGFRITQNEALVLKDNGEFEVHGPTIKITPGVFLLPFRIKEYQDYKKNIAETQKVLQGVCPRITKIESSDFTKLSLKVLINQLKKLMEIADKIIYIRFRYNIYPSFVAGKFLNSKLKKLSPTVSQYDIFSELHYKTWDMNVAISRLAGLINQNNKLSDTIINIKKNANLEKTLKTISEEYPKFGALYRRILEEYGWKSTSTYLAFSASSWNENKINFLILLKIAMERQENMNESEKYTDICRQISNQFSIKKSKKIISLMEKIRSYHQNREESLYLLEKCYGLGRIIVSEISKRYPHIFISPRDILFLTLEEVYSLRDGVTTGIHEKIKMRKKSMIKNQMLWDEMEVQTINIGENQLKGISGNTGKVKGKVCVIQDISEFGKLKQGDILVCKYTDPVWTPLFTIAKAVVSDTGGPLSHSAIVAREYNIPAVLGCGNATKILSDGQEIFVDGEEGIVSVL